MLSAAHHYSLFLARNIHAMYMLHSISSRSISILLSHLCLVLPNKRSLNFPYQDLYAHPPPVLSILFHSALQHSVSSSVHEAPHYAISCSPMLLHSSQRLMAKFHPLFHTSYRRKYLVAPLSENVPTGTILSFLSLQNIVCY